MTLDKRTLVVSGLRDTGSSESRELAVFYDFGAEVRWFGSECMLAFPTESQTTSALAAASKTQQRVSRISALAHVDEGTRASYYRVAAEMHEQLKPERDSRAANRLIGAALGIKLPAAKSKQPPVAPVAVHKAPVVDAWDD